MRQLSVVLGFGLVFSPTVLAGEKASIKVPSAHAEKKAVAVKADKPKKQRKGPRFDLKRSRELRGRLFRDWDSGLQFAVKKGKLRKLKPAKDAKGIVWETQVSVGTIAIRTRLDSINGGEFQSQPELTNYLDEISMAYRDSEIEPREVVILESDLKDGMGLVEAGASLDVVLPKGKHCCEQLWVLVQGTKRVTISIRYTSNDVRRGRWIAFQNKFLEALKLANTDLWK